MLFFDPARYSYSKRRIKWTLSANGRLNNSIFRHLTALFSAPRTICPKEKYLKFAPMANAIFEFTPEGSLDMLLSFSAEELEDAAKHGERVRDGYLVAESKPWKEVDGKFYYLEDIEGEIMGSEIDPYFEIKVQPDGSLMYCMDMLLLERV